ncbi:hypothetical protein [Pseudonocardia sp. 73-21]|uniref:hypothetical protein n=1 Tax=Pseudonocardia sp. 73-21 TaxID=1895809 RepID=UPI00095BB2ED|nr:hypothetical protein [Pseudonocardia sp. 73-21]OJY38468.1 MAG: hypothetical protein BGP03_13040 [Pseudonocardia sp. 73-21]
MAREITDVQRLYLVCTAYQAQMAWREALERGEDPAVAGESLAGLPEVSAMDAIEANRRLVEVLLRWRRDAVLAARATGSTWTAIGAALGTTKQRAHAWFRPAATP